MRARRAKQAVAAVAMAATSLVGLQMAPAGAATNCAQLHRLSFRLAVYMDLYMDLGWQDEWAFAYMSWETVENMLDSNGC